MTTARLWTIGAILAVVAILGGAFGLGVQPRLAAAAAADDTAAATDAQNATTQAELARLSRAAAKQSDLDQAEADVEAAVPSTLKMNTLSRMLRNAAALDGVTIDAFAPSTPIEYAPTVGDSSASTATTAATPAPSASPTASATPTPAAPAGKSPWFGTTDAQITAANFTVVPLSVTVEGPAAAVEAFASDAQRVDRLFAVTTVSTNLDKDTGVTTGTVAGYVYTLQR